MSQRPHGFGTAFVLATVVVQFGLGLPQLLAHLHTYPSPWIPCTAFVLLAATISAGWWVIQGRRVPTPVVVGGVTTVGAASIAITATLPDGAFFDGPHWSFGLVGWHLLMLLSDRPVRWSMLALAAHTGFSVVAFLTTADPSRAVWGTGLITVVSVMGFQAALGLAGADHRRRALHLEALAEEQARLATAKAVADELDRGRVARVPEQLGSALPLLAGLADGTLDPGRDDVRRQSAVVAAQLRRLFAEGDESPDPLVHELSACAEIAEKRGLQVSFAVSGAVVPVPLEARRALVQPVVDALAAARARARITVLRTAESVRVAAVCDGNASAQTSSAPSDLVAVEWHSVAEQVWMEARWTA
ncbi:sensor histidine kinase [Kineosporia babensis]|uniref:Uncharacterized protein n=1 Tax=Kineosporia babensis TaxID=499548 RepID=A0A9X1SYN3_9ACTN|nr:hypothetical protein [Kineosporia babensis]MCD5311158.1 hypothetical protein [Kineosporia babensis]